MRTLQLSDCFSDVVTVPLVCDGDSVVAVLQALQSSTVSTTEEAVFTTDELKTIASFVSECKNFKVSMKQLVRLYRMYVGDGKERNIHNFLCWIKKELDLS